MQMLRQAFEKHGDVVDAFVAYNGRSSRGFGYVTFKEPSGAATAVTPLHLFSQISDIPALRCLRISVFQLQVASVNGVSLGDDDRSREIRVEMVSRRLNFGCLPVTLEAAV